MLSHTDQELADWLDDWAADDAYWVALMGNHGLPVEQTLWYTTLGCSSAPLVSDGGLVHIDSGWTPAWI